VYKRQDFDPGIGIDTIPLRDGLFTNDHWLAKYSKNMELDYLESFYSDSWSEDATLEIGDQDEIYISGWFTDTLHVDFSSNSFYLLGKNVASPRILNRHPDVYICKYDSSAQLAWAKKLEVISTQSIVFYGAQYAAAGSFNSPAHEYHPKMWSLPNGELYYAIAFSDTLDINPDVIGGEYYSRGEVDFLLTKLDAQGNFQWVKQFGGAGNDQILDIQVNHVGEIYLAGYFTDSLDLDPGLGVNQVTSKGEKDIFFAKYDSTGNFMWGHAMGGPNNDRVSNLRIDSEGSILLAGNFQDSVDFDIDPNAQAVRYCEGLQWGGLARLEDAFVAKYRRRPQPIITEEPEDTVLCACNQLLLGVGASGSNLSYQWYVNGVAISGATDSTLAFNPVSAADSGFYYCEVSLNCSLARQPIVRRTDSIHLGVRQLIQLTSQPVDVQACTGDSVGLSLAAQGNGLSYQWYQDNNAVAGANTPTISFSSLAAQDTGLYFCEIQGECGLPVNTQLVNLGIIPSPAIELQPRDTIGCLGSNTSLSVPARGDGVTYQWFFGNQPVGGKSHTLTITTVSAAATGPHYCPSTVS